MTSVDWLVVGSGPSGCAAAAALIQAGIRPVVVDGGFRSIREKHGALIASRHDPGRKDWFGSTDAYAQPKTPIISYRPDLLARASYGIGGFSRVWGATATLPTDWSEWPEDCRPSAPDVALLWDLMPRAMTTWQTSREMPPGSIPGSRLSGTFMDAVLETRNAQDWLVRPSTVAVETHRGADSLCRPCSQCLNGCPRDAIWFSGDLIEKWRKTDLIHHRPGVAVLSMSESPCSVEVRIREPTGVEDRITAGRVLVAAGPISSASIALASGLADSVRIKDTATAFAGVLSAHFAPNLGGFNHGLSQWWISDARQRLLAQVYPPSAEHATRLASRLPFGGHWTLSAARRLARHVHPVIAYLCEDESDSVVVTREGGHIIASTSGEHARTSFARRLRDLAAVFRRAGYWMPSRATEFPPAGTGYHLGASWPHGRGTDALGRMPGTERIHFVDASVLPRLGLGSITPTIMVNAIRIVRQTSEIAV